MEGQLTRSRMSTISVSRFISTPRFSTVRVKMFMFTDLTIPNQIYTEIRIVAAIDKVTIHALSFCC